MKVSEYYKLNMSQEDLEFVDVDVVEDTFLFVDPCALESLEPERCAKCKNLLEDCFKTVLNALEVGNTARAHEILDKLRETSETHLGFCCGHTDGWGLERDSVPRVAKSLTSLVGGKAPVRRLLENIVDTILLVENVGPDVVSDMTTNIIRSPLIEYTQEMCKKYEITVEEVDSGVLWDLHKHEWYDERVSLPVVGERKLLLVPKEIVRQYDEFTYNYDEYYRHYLLEHLRGVELRDDTELVEKMKSGERRVSIKNLKKKYGVGKAAAAKLTGKHPKVLEKYRKDKELKVKKETKSKK